MAAQRNNVSGMIKVAYIYENGTNGVPLNYKKALEWYFKLYEVEARQALLKLYQFYKEGRGCKKDKKQAQKYLEEAFLLGQTNGQMASEIASSYRLGLNGLKKDIHQAIYWYEKAVELGNTIVSYYLYQLKEEQEEKNK